MRIAALQMVSTPDVATNLATARRLIAQAADAGAELAVLPEYFCLMGRREADKLAIAEAPGDGPMQSALAEAAQRHGVWLAAGTLPLHASVPQRVRNTTLVFDPHGQCAARYDKMHLFCFDNGQERYDEGAVLEAGDTPTAFDLTDRSGHAWRVGLSICYDLRFPELYRTLAADLLLVPAAFTYTTGQAHWELLLRARAVENLAYVLACGQGGEHENGRRTWGQSMVIGPWGEVLAQQASGEGAVLAEISPEALRARRQQLPALSHRRL